MKTRRRALSVLLTAAMLLAVLPLAGMISLHAAAAADFVPVAGIYKVPVYEKAGTAFTLTGTVFPKNATNQTITWRVKDAGATGAAITDGYAYVNGTVTPVKQLTAAAAGKTVVTTVVKDGLGESEDYIQDFAIQIASADAEAPIVREQSAQLFFVRIQDPEESGRYYTYAYSGGMLFSADLLTFLSADFGGYAAFLPTAANEVSLAHFMCDFDNDNALDASSYEWDSIGGALAELDVFKSADYAAPVLDNKTVYINESVSTETHFEYVGGDVQIIAQDIISRRNVDIYEISCAIDAELFMPVTAITGIPANITAGAGLLLSDVTIRHDHGRPPSITDSYDLATVVPSDATNRHIDWRVKDAGGTGAAVNGHHSVDYGFDPIAEVIVPTERQRLVLETTGPGTLVLSAVITDGLAPGEDYTQDFTITVNPAAGWGFDWRGDPPVNGGGDDAENPFIDIKESDWFYRDVLYVQAHGLIVGTDADKYSPGVSLTRSMAVTALYRHAGSPELSGPANPFGDVQAGSYYDGAVRWAAANGIAAGIGGGRFDPEVPVTRQDLAVLLDRYAAFAGIALPEMRPYAAFKDDTDRADYAKEAVETFFRAGVINGKDNNVFDPRGGATRAEAAAMLHRFLETANKE
ncbi:MAG: S-layer homology domain-containing protein [Oscillospiraceae bacterium]|jgi:hypothetical protein|nr:S-layer homology domain-containing protein [Oscillospiraceae bacterium]